MSSIKDLLKSFMLTELFKGMYDEPIHPRNLWLHDEPLGHAEVDEVYRANIRRLQERGAWTPPAVAHEGARYIPAAPGDPGEAWAMLKAELDALWRVERPQVTAAVTAAAAQT